MAFQALLFCPDEKIAATVTQVLGELEFTVVPCAEPFAAVKRLMADRFDAVVVDLDNEQNAALLFKSARGSSSNQNALAVAVVEGQAGVAKAFRLGANLVLTKPVNIEQAKGTLRVARGLLKKNELAKAAAPTSPAAPPPVATEKPVAVPRPKPSIDPGILFEEAPEMSERAANVPPAAAQPVLPKKPAFAATAAATTPAEKVPAASVPPRMSVPVSATGSAAAAAPAREVVPKHIEDVLPTPTSTPAVQDAEAAEEKVSVETSAEPVSEEKPYPFTFGGTNKEQASEESSGGSKRVLGAVAALVIGAAGYYGWNAMHGSPSQSGSSRPPVAAPVKAAPVVSSPVSSAVQPAAAPAATTPAPAGEPTANSTTQPETAVEDTPAPIKSTPTSKKAVPASKAAPTSQPIVVGHSSKIAQKSDADVAPPSLIGMASPGAANVPAISSEPTLPKPVLDTIKVSQGVSQGLLVKRVQPIYPPNALQAKIEGDVRLVVTISKTGDISAVTVASGSPLFSKAAADAVRQWKYKPYLLNGEPVEIQTDITVRFKVPR